MLSYDDALTQILDSVQRSLPSERVPLEEVLGRVLANDVFAAEDLPRFANSAVDGFAVRIADTHDANTDRPITLRVVETIAAGTAPTVRVGPGQAARILTGAVVPEGADALVMVEDTVTEAEDGSEWVRCFDSGTASHIRAAGSDLPAGASALGAGSVLNAGAIGLLAALNQAAVPCYARPRVGLIVTGDELVPVGNTPLLPGQIRNSNGPALAAAIQAAGGVVAVLRHAADSEESTCEALRACADCDLIVSSGGVSVGTFDYVKATVEKMGALDFWRIAIKPGKPLAFGRVGDAIFVGLPGNPVSSLVTFELFVRPLIRKMGGNRFPLRRTISAILTETLPHTPGRREFVRATLEWKIDTFFATPTGSQMSHRLASLHAVDTYLIAHEEQGDYAPGAQLEALLLSP